MCVLASIRATRYIVKIINTLDIKRYMLLSLYKRKISTDISYTGEVN